jgi:hypothetical protein
MKKFLLMFILFTGICLPFEHLSTSDILNDLKFNGLLEYGNGNLNKSHKLLSQYLIGTMPEEKDWKIYVIFYLINRDMNSCNFRPLNFEHKKIIYDTNWKNKVEEIINNCEDNNYF